MCILKVLVRLYEVPLIHLDAGVGHLQEAVFGIRRVASFVFRSSTAFMRVRLPHLVTGLRRSSFHLGAFGDKKPLGWPITCLTGPVVNDNVAPIPKVMSS